MVSARVHIYQDDDNGKMLPNSAFFVKEDDYVSFRQEFTMAVYVSYNDETHMEKWRLWDKVIFCKTGVM